MQDSFNLLTKRFSELLKDLIIWAPDLIVSIIVLILFVIIARIVRKSIRNVIERIRPESAITQLITNIVYVSVIIVGIIFSLEVLHLSNTVNKLLAGAGIIGLGISFAFQDILANVLAGIIIAMRKPIEIGDMVDINGTLGEVESIKLRTVNLHNYKGQAVIIPSKTVLQNNIINFTRKEIRRIDVNVGVSYDSDLDKVKEICKKTIEQLPFILKEKPIDFYFMDFAESSILISIRFWINLKTYPDFTLAKSEAISSIKKAFDENEIHIPFPVRTIDINENISKVYNAK